MKRMISFLFLVLLLLAGCGQEQNNDTKEVDQPANIPLVTKSLQNSSYESDNNVTPIINRIQKNEEEVPSITLFPAAFIDSDNSLHFDLSSAASILIKSAPDSNGIKISDKAALKDITHLLTTFRPYLEKTDHKSEYDYTLSFYDTNGNELATIEAQENFVIRYQEQLYYDNAEQFVIERIRQIYIEEVKKTFSYDSTSFFVNGNEFNLQNIVDPSINAITTCTWFGYEDYPEPTVLLDCHINPDIGYCTIFDVEKMDFVFGAYGTSFNYHLNSDTSLIYAFQDSVYNYWGDILYQNNDDNYFIYSLEYSPDTDQVDISLSSRQEEKLIQVSRINYHNPYSYFSELCSENNIIPEQISEIRADLTHEGPDEILTIVKTDVGGDYACLQVCDTAGNILWQEEAHTSHAGWNSVFLCTRNAKDYLLVFNPYMSTGSANYMYTLFYLLGPNKIQTIDSGTYAFCEGAKLGSEGAFNEDTFRPFAEKVYSYLKDSYVLLSTESGTLIYSTADQPLSLAVQYEPTKWIKENKSYLY